MPLMKSPKVCLNAVYMHVHTRISIKTLIAANSIQQTQNVGQSVTHNNSYQVSVILNGAMEETST